MPLTTLKDNRAFESVMRNGKFAVKDYLVLYVMENALDHSRYGISMGSKIGKATLRNRIRRWIRGILSDLEDRLRDSRDFVVVVRKAENWEFQEFKARLLYLLENRGMLRSL